MCETVSLCGCGSERAKLLLRVEFLFDFYLVYKLFDCTGLFLYSSFGDLSKSQTSPSVIFGTRQNTRQFCVLTV